MWFVYTILFLGALASIVNAVILIALAMLLVRLVDHLTPEAIKQKKKKRRRGQMIEGEGLMDVVTPQVTYDTPREIAQNGPQG